jgi:hypothetical protein
VISEIYGILGEQEKEEVKRTEERSKYHSRLIILHEILNDLLTFKSLKDPDSAKDYQ